MGSHKLRNIVLSAIVGTTMLLSGCGREADIASYNLSKEADSFNIKRRLVVFNVRDNKPIMKVEGLISINVDEVENQLEIMAKLPDGSYVKNFIGLNEWVTYSIEQMDSKKVSQYGYEFTFNPENIIPIRIENGVQERTEEPKVDADVTNYKADELNK